MNLDDAMDLDLEEDAAEGFEVEETRPHDVAAAVWINPPKRCAVCRLYIPQFFVHAKLTLGINGGTWGAVCVPCFDAVGNGIGDYGRRFFCIKRSKKERIFVTYRKNEGSDAAMVEYGHRLDS